MPPGLKAPSPGTNCCVRLVGTAMTRPAQPPAPHDLFDPDQLTPELKSLLGSKIGDVVAATFGDRGDVHVAERAWARAVADALSIDINVSGLANIDQDAQYVVAPLHEGFADVLALLELPLDLSWVIRDELLNLPYFGTYLRSAGHIAIEPESPRAALRTMIERAPDALDAGDSLVIFPQGSLLGIDVSFRQGAFLLAERFGLDVLPVVLTGSHQVWDYPFSTELRYGQKIALKVLPPVPTQRAMNQMRAMEREMKRLALLEEDAPARRYIPERDGLWEGYSFDIDVALQEPDSATA